jgi:hypothetical protein
MTQQMFLSRLQRDAVRVLPALFFTLTSAAQAPTPASASSAVKPLTPALQVISDAAKNTQDMCFKMMYRDVNAYSQCIRNQRDQKNSSAAQRLGAAYFGFVGGLSYMRLSHVNATYIANEFLQSYRPLQKKLGISDADLCSTVPGDCTMRIRQTNEMRASPPPPAPSMRMLCQGQNCRLVPVENPPQGVSPGSKPG